MPEPNAPASQRSVHTNKLIMARALTAPQIDQMVALSQGGSKRSDRDDFWENESEEESVGLLLPAICFAFQSVDRFAVVFSDLRNWIMVGWVERMDLACFPGEGLGFAANSDDLVRRETQPRL
jgi:hypothetical protein